MRIHQGNLAAAAEPLDESLELARALAERNPEDGDRLFELGQACFWVGFVHWQRGELADALGDFESYLDVSRRLVAMDPTNLPWRLELAYAHSNIGSIHQARLALPEALEQFREALALKRSWSLGTSWRLLGSTLATQGEHRAAVRELQRSLAVLEPLVESEPTAVGPRRAAARMGDASPRDRRSG